MGEMSSLRPGSLRPGDGSVLLVHSDPALRRAFTRLLAQRGHTVTVVDSRDAALTELAAQPFGVIVLDHDDHDGQALLAQLRQRHASVQRVVLSGASIVEEIWVQRPVMPEELLAAVSGRIAATPGARTDSLPVIVRRTQDGGFRAECPVLVDGVAEAPTREGAIAGARRAVERALKRGDPLTGEVVSFALDD